MKEINSERKGEYDLRSSSRKEESFLEVESDICLLKSLTDRDQLWIIFLESSKLSLTPSPHFQKIILHFFSFILKKPCSNVQNLQYKFWIENDPVSLNISENSSILVAPPVPTCGVVIVQSIFWITMSQQHQWSNHWKTAWERWWSRPGSGWQNLAAFRREQKYQWKFSSSAYLQFSRQMRCFCV